MGLGAKEFLVLSNPLKLLFFATLTLSAHATQDSTYGLGGATTGRVSAVTAELDNPFAALYNPGLLAAQRQSSFMFTTALTGSSYEAFPEIVVDSPQFRTDSANLRIEKYQLPSNSPVLWTLGFTLPFSLPPYMNRRAGIGITLSGPYSKLRSFASSTPYDFVSLRYGTSDSQFKGTVSGGVEIIPRTLYLGGGISLYITAAGAADAVLFNSNPTGRLNLDVGLNTAALAGFYSEIDENSFGLVYRQAINPTFEQKFAGGVGVTSNTSSLMVPLTLKTSLYYEPHSFDFDWQRDFGILKASAGISYQLWSGYQPSFLVIQTTDANHQAQTTLLPQIPFRNTWNPRVSFDIPFLQRRLWISTGYQYRPTPVIDISGPGNILDSSAHVVGLSARYYLPMNPVLPLPLTFGIFGQVHFLESRKIIKNDPTFVGAPNYTFAGNAYTCGVSVQAEL
jgi:hypothetical protein